MVTVTTAKTHRERGEGKRPKLVRRGGAEELRAVHSKNQERGGPEEQILYNSSVHAPVHVIHIYIHTRSCLDAQDRVDEADEDDEEEGVEDGPDGRPQRVHDDAARRRARVKG